MSTTTQALKLERTRSQVPWSFRWFRRLPWSPAFSGLVTALALLVAFALAEFLTGRPQALLQGQSSWLVGCEYLRGDYRIAVVGIILLVASATARYVLANWTRQTALELDKPQLEDADSMAVRCRWGFLPGTVGIVICFLFAIDISERQLEWTSDYWILPHVVNWGWCVPFGWVGGRLIFALITNALIISRIAEAIEVRDLTETKALNVAVRHGSRSAMLSLMFLGLISVHFLDPGLNWTSTVLLAALFLIGAGISAWPTFGVMQNLYDFRDAQLERLEHELEVEHKQMLDKDPDYEPGRIGDIVALERRLRDWRVSVFHIRAVVRLTLFALIGFISWLGAAAVSVLVENFFGF